MRPGEQEGGTRRSRGGQAQHHRPSQQGRVVELAPALLPAAPGDLLLQRREQSGRCTGEDEVEAGERGEPGRSQRLSGDDQVDIGGARLHGQADQQGVAPRAPRTAVVARATRASPGLPVRLPASPSALHVLLHWSSNLGGCRSRILPQRGQAGPGVAPHPPRLERMLRRGRLSGPQTLYSHELVIPLNSTYAPWHDDREFRAVYDAVLGLDPRRPVQVLRALGAARPADPRARATSSRWACGVAARES